MTIPYAAFVVGFGLVSVAALTGAIMRWRERQSETRI